MSICVLSMIATLNAVGCLPAQVCLQGKNGVQYCQPDWAKSCPTQLPVQFWECTRLDGSKYTEPYESK